MSCDVQSAQISFWPQRYWNLSATCGHDGNVGNLSEPGPLCSPRHTLLGSDNKQEKGEGEQMEQGKKRKPTCLSLLYSLIFFFTT